MDELLKEIDRFRDLTSTFTLFDVDIVFILAFGFTLILGTIVAFIMLIIGSKRTAVWWLILILLVLPSACEEPKKQDEFVPKVCQPYSAICVDNNVFRCRADGSEMDFFEKCPVSKPCVDGVCLSSGDAPDTWTPTDQTAPPDTNGDPDLSDVHMDPDVVDAVEDSDEPYDMMAETNTEVLFPDSQELPDLPPAPCGNGQLDQGELCDPVISEGAEGACPTQCPDSEGCTQWELLGNAENCTAECRSGSIVMIGPSDGCCPPGGNALSDPDCLPDCGNNVTEAPDEECDGTSIPVSCEDEGFPAGDMLCSDDCTLDTSLCGESYGMLVHQKIPNLLFTGDFYDVSWHPDGSHALLLASGGKLVRYDAESKTLSEAWQFENVLYVNRLDYAPSGDFALIVGADESSPRMWKFDPEAGTVADHNLVDYGGLILTVVVFDKSGDRVAFGGYMDTDVTYLFVSQAPFETVDKMQAYADYRGLNDILWAEPDPLVYDGAEYLLTSEGYNGANSHSWILDVDTVMGNDWSPGFGNPARGQCQPGGNFCFIAAGTSGKMYVWDQGSWPYPPLSVDGAGSSMASVAWNQSGTRCLVIGRPVGNPVKGTVVEYRLNPGLHYTQGEWIDQSIPGWGNAPYNGDFNTHLRHIAWRPNSPCQEGLIAASDTGTSWSPNFGIVVRFYDSSDPDCD